MTGSWVAKGASPTIETKVPNASRAASQSRRARSGSLNGFGINMAKNTVSERAAYNTPMNSNAANHDPLADVDRASLIHPFSWLREYAAGDSRDPRIITGGKGIRIRDSQGNELIDVFAGVYCVHAGYGRTEITEAIHAAAQKLAYYHAYSGFSNEPAILLARKILELMPPGMQRVYFGLSGSDANETQLKLVWY